MLNPVWVRTFSALAKCGGFTRAAEELGLTQAAVSQHVARLEERLGRLLIRRPRRIELTPAGEALLDYGRALEGAERRLSDRLADADADAGEVSLITPGSVGLVLYPILLDMQKNNPGLVVRHRFAPDFEVLDAVANNRYELGLVTLKPDEPRLAASVFAHEPLELVAPVGTVVERWEDLQRVGFIDHPDGQAMASRLLSQHFPRNPGVRTLPIKGFINQIALILEPVALGLGFTVIPRYARQAFARPEAIRVVEGSSRVVDTLWLIHRAEWPLSARAEKVLARMRGGLARAEARIITKSY